MNIPFKSKHSFFLADYPTRQRETANIYIDGVFPATMKLLLKFVYEDRVDEDDVTWELFDVASLCDVGNLEDVCLNVLTRRFDATSCVVMLEAGYYRGQQDLFDLAVGFVRRNRAEVTRTDEWRRLVAEDGHLAGVALGIESLDRPLSRRKKNEAK
jgi:hypothetical protein